MSTNLSGNTLTLGSTSLNEETLKALKSYYYIPDNCKAGDTVILDGIECLCVATGVTIQGSNLTRIAIDKNYDLGYYQKYVGININGATVDYIREWIWGGYETLLGNTSQEVGYGLQNTINCLANSVSYTNGTAANNETTYNRSFLWIGVNDFRSSHSDKWFVPSINELLNYVYPYRSSLTFDKTTGGHSAGSYISSSEAASHAYYEFSFNTGSAIKADKSGRSLIRLCRAF